jgi:ketosteroid isomerase-like protein
LAWQRLETRAPRGSIQAAAAILDDVSRRDVELILATVGAYNAGDIDAWAESLDPDIEAVPDTSFPESSRLLGRDAYRAWTEELASGLVSPRWVTTEVRDLGADRVLHRGDWGGIGAVSGIETYSSITGVFTVRAGRISRVEFYFDHARALKAAGLAD